MTMKMILRASLSFNGSELELFTICSPTPTPTSPTAAASLRKLRNSFEKLTGLDGNSRNSSNSSLSPHHYYHIEKHHQAAIRLQKVYKSFRTRRRLADCAVLVEQRWWKLMDFAELKRSSISFFDMETNETAVSKWTRATTRAAKVGKGLSKDEKARKLALQHWLEAIDPRHRYGHNLQFYYGRWLRCDSKQPFFYWLDIGEGKEVNLEWCPRQKLQQQCIKYLGPVERKAYEAVVVEGKFMYRQSGEIVDTAGGPEEAKWIFVLSASKVLYVGKKKKGTFQHSSFLAGGATLAAGRLVVHDGHLKSVWPHSGHYLPTEENFQELMSFLAEQNVDLTNVKRSPTADEEAVVFRRNEHIACFPSNQDLSQLVDSTNAEKSDPVENDGTQLSMWSRRLGSEITKLEIPNISDAMNMFGKTGTGGVLDPETSSEDGYETADMSFSEEEFMVPKMNLFDEDKAEEHGVPKEMIMQRIDSHKGLRSYQLAQQLTSRWTTGAGPRIGCMRDYPLELQVRVLEESRLSPRGVIPPVSTPPTRSRFSSPMTPTRTPIRLYRDAWPGGSPLSPNILVEAATP